MHPHRSHPYLRPSSPLPEQPRQARLPVLGVNQHAARLETQGENVNRNDFTSWLQGYEQALANEPLVNQPVNALRGDGNILLAAASVSLPELPPTPTPTTAPNLLRPMPTTLQRQPQPLPHPRPQPQQATARQNQQPAAMPAQAVASTSSAARLLGLTPTILPATNDTYSLAELGLSLYPGHQAQGKISVTNIEGYGFNDTTYDNKPASTIELIKWHATFGAPLLARFHCCLTYLALRGYSPASLCNNFDTTAAHITKCKNVYLKLGIDGLLSAHRMLSLLRENQTMLGMMRAHIQQTPNLRAVDLMYWLRERGYYIGVHSASELLTENIL